MSNADVRSYRRRAVFAMACLPVLSQALADGPTEQASYALSLEIQSEVFLRRGNAVVTQIDLDARIAGIPERLRGPFLASPDRLTDTVNNLITTRQMYQAALEDQPDLLEDPLHQARLMQQVEQTISHWWMDSRWEKERLENYDARARELYLAKPFLFRESDRYDITIAWVQPDGGKSEVEAMRRIIEIHDAAGEEDLAEVSRRMSDRSGNDEAQVSFERVSLDELDETVGRMVRSISTGELSDPFRAASGWYVVRLDAIHQGNVPKFEQIETQARRVAENRHREAFEERFLRALNAEPVSIAEGSVESLLSRYPHQEDDRRQLLQDIESGFRLE